MVYKATFCNVIVGRVLKIVLFVDKMSEIHSLQKIEYITELLYVRVILFTNI